MSRVPQSLAREADVYFEERDLVRQWGPSYLDYKRRIGCTALHAALRWNLPIPT